jgi:hypothetical protein
MTTRIAKEENENFGKQSYASSRNVGLLNLPMPKKFEPYDDHQDEKTKGNIDSPSEPKRPLETPPGNQREDEHRQLAGQAEQIFRAIRFDRRQANPRVDMHKPVTATASTANAPPASEREAMP